ncbi:uncharacterized protein LOC114189193 isoform X1 [Vigna unguiculata]|uniref:uncharacterized protein LOC114189193 isoform X1 n=2 Tax=Vigna unguiculata TaxID=3917 RepID=UPI001015D863|nr:uncharacterized protein LOC114189193 isoform X1 [Vigna unguiculata]XP_027933704.1 uncharacterized protein LOC114189193 isoform X1 [Vigna unguiculata]XP_027933705.1 uncharacterized protein LOC114189193 isoform X1 [Vigna unguiculata]XP_027933706.1 uncharacterized protein LOC114189193 isoform X1 [Vigna unguiculata]
MVCSPGDGGKMGVMARLLASQTVADDFAYQKSAAEYISTELREADEANLLQEEDMHVYGVSPMTDGLQLVCCNNCKKPIKDSQFAAHTELCQSLKLSEQTRLEFDGSTGSLKPPRKEKKKLAASCANQASAVGEHRRSGSMDNIDSDLSQSHRISQIRVIPFSNKVKVPISLGHSTCVDGASMMDGTRINPGNKDHPASVMHPPTKRHKLRANTHLPVLESPGRDSGETKTLSFTDGITCKDLVEITTSEHGDPNRKILGQVLVQHPNTTKNEFPAPLATKIFYSQRTNRLRARLRHLYFQNLNEQLRTDLCPKTSPEDMVTFQDSSLRCPSSSQLDNVPEGRSSPQKSDHILAKSSEVCVLKAGGLPSNGLSNQFLLDNVSRSTATHVGLTRSNFLPTSYSFSSNTGNSLGTMQQPNGSVPVI